MDDLIYRVEQGQLVSQLMRCSRVDGHVHSRYSGVNPTLYVPNKTTRFMGVRESYTKPGKIHRMMWKRGMRFFTISDHDSILGALELRNIYPDTSFINCEYTVTLEPKFSNQVIHVGCWGLDYPGDTGNPLSDRIVMELHDNIMQHRHLGYEQFIEYCRSVGVTCVFNHPPYQCNSKNRIDGVQFDELTDAFDILEINGDMQLENLFTFEVALQKNKILCAGTDAHTSRRIANQFTVSLYPTHSPYEFLQAFRKGDIGIGSRFSLPDSIDSPSLYDIVKHQFNGSVSELQKDTFEGERDYWLYEWGIRKFATFGGAAAASLAISAGVGALAGAEYALIPFGILTTLQALAFFAVSSVIPRREKNANARRTRKLYKEYHEHLLEKETREPREMISFHEQEVMKHQSEIEDHRQIIRKAEESHDTDLPRIIKEPRGWDRLTFRSLRRFDAFGSDYDLSSRLDCNSTSKQNT